MENNSASSRDPASLEVEVIFSPTPQYSDSGETPAETPAHDCGKDAAARENSGEANKEDTAHSVNTRSRSRSALLTAAHSEGQTQIPDTDPKSATGEGKGRKLAEEKRTEPTAR